MKRYLMTLVMMLGTLVSINAMSYEQARREAMYLADKMAYELNLNDIQYEQCYEINLDYLMSLSSEYDAYGAYLTYRNNDMRCILHDWQWHLFAATEYFFRPVCWRNAAWYFPIYGHYHHTYYYCTELPRWYYSYRGGHGRFYYRDGYYTTRRSAWTSGFRGSDRGRAHIDYNVTRSGSRGGRRESWQTGGTRGSRFDGVRTEGTRGSRFDGVRTEGTRGGTRTEGTRTEGSRFGGTRTEGTRTEGSFGGRRTDRPSSSRSTVTQSGTRGGSFSGGSRGGSSFSGGSFSSGIRGGGSTTRSGGSSFSGGSRSGGGSFSGGSRGGGSGASRGGGRGGR